MYIYITKAGKIFLVIIKNALPLADLLIGAAYTEEMVGIVDYQAPSFLNSGPLLPIISIHPSPKIYFMVIGNSQR